MRTITFTEFRKNASALFSAVEEGETIHVIRRGKAIAKIVPIGHDRGKQASWKKRRPKPSVRGDSFSKVIFQERESK